MAISNTCRSIKCLYILLSEDEAAGIGDLAAFLAWRTHRVNS